MAESVPPGLLSSSSPDATSIYTYIVADFLANFYTSFTAGYAQQTLLMGKYHAFRAHTRKG